MELFECFAGDKHFYVIAPEFTKGVQAAWKRLGAKTANDLPKPFDFRRVDENIVVVVGRKRRQ